MTLLNAAAPGVVDDEPLTSRPARAVSPMAIVRAEPICVQVTLSVLQNALKLLPLRTRRSHAGAER
jgi:hypothetical protein